MDSENSHAATNALLGSRHVPSNRGRILNCSSDPRAGPELERFKDRVAAHLAAIADARRAELSGRREELYRQGRIAEDRLRELVNQAGALRSNHNVSMEWQGRLIARLREAETPLPTRFPTPEEVMARQQRIDTAQAEVDAGRGEVQMIEAELRAAELANAQRELNRVSMAVREIENELAGRQARPHGLQPVA